MAKVLIETRLNALKLVESTNPPRKGCLGRMEGVCADFKNPTRNGRLYTRKLWDNVFKNALFQEALSSKTLIGELDHPEDRFEPLAKFACIVMTDYRIDEQEGVIYAGFDILDTPQGQILKSLLDYGCILGVSSRGQGDIVESYDGTGEVVEEDSYDFACFDVVTTPAVEKARQKVTESLRLNKIKTFQESLKKQIEEASTVEDLNIIRSVVRTSTLNKVDMDTFIESIEHRCNSISEGKTISSTEQELQDAYLKISDLSNQLENNSPTKTIRENKEIFSCIKDLRKQVIAYKHREKRFVESINSRNNEISKLKERVRTYNTQQSQKSSVVRTVTENYNEVDSKYKESQKTVINLTQKTNELQEQVKTLQKENNVIKNQLVSCKTELKSVQQKSKRVTESICKKHDLEIQKMDNEVSTNNELLEEFNNKIDDYENKVQRILEELNKTKSNNSKLNERNKTISNSLQEYQKEFLKEASKVYGVDYRLVENRVNTETSSSDIKNILKEEQKRLDRYNKLPISNQPLTGTKIISENIQPREQDLELQKLANFCESVSASM